MKRFLLGLCSALLLSSSFSAATAAASEIEREVEARVASEKVTVVHFWASWCPNCKSEHADEGWKKFIMTNPDVEVVFISIWGSDVEDQKLLEGYGLTGLPNFTALRHPNQSRRREERMNDFLGRPVTWIPSTWVFRKGTLRYALNYGEVRFNVLQQLVDDTTTSWSHKR